MPLDAENEIEYTFCSGLVRHNYIWGGGGGLRGCCCGSRSVNVQFDINLATSVTSIRV